MTFAELSAAGEDPVRPFGKSPQDKSRIDTPGTHDPEGPHIGRVLKP